MISDLGFSMGKVSRYSFLPLRPCIKAIKDIFLTIGQIGAFSNASFIEIWIEYINVIKDLLH